MIKYIDGNLFDSDADIICHQVNCQGKMGSGVALEVKKRYPHVYEDYRLHYNKFGLKLGTVILVDIREDESQCIANLCAQENYGYDNNKYTDYNSLRKCFESLITDIEDDQFDKTPTKGRTIAFPYKMSCDRGGGDWDIVSKMIEDTFEDYNVEIWRLQK